MRPGLAVQRSLTEVVAEAGSLEEEVAGISPEDLPGYFRCCRDEPHTLACVREVIRRTLNLRLYDVQLQAGLVMLRGQIAEMATGEGKTLAAAIPAAWGAREGNGVHVATVNAYLAERDEEILRPAYAALGLRSACVPEQGSHAEKKAAYEADITYATGYGFGFDFLRDRLQELGRPPPRLGEAWLRDLSGAGRREETAGSLQRPFAFGVIDEVDSVLIDEALTPLILSRPTPPGENPAAPLYQEAQRQIRELEEGRHLQPSDTGGAPTLTREGLRAVYENKPGIQEASMRRAWHHYIENALHANHLFQRDIHYLVNGDAVEIIDLNTGRRFKDRKWRNGLHQAVEAKEGVTITHETTSDVTISRQQLYQMYPNLCGLTGTAWEERRELQSVYDLKVVPIPRHRPLRRRDLPPYRFASRKEMLEAVVRDVREKRRTGQPVLVGTRSLQMSERISTELDRAGLPHAVLNARQDQEEAERIGMAGRKGQVTVATNMAGRGADIPLGPGVEELGGLHVMGIEWNDAARIDRQLVGRAGRQGSPGSSRFYLTAEDDLFRDLSPRGVPSLRKFRQAQRMREKESARRRRAVMREHKWLDKLKAHA
jgi:preprotein translocase subunit SecA